MADTHADPCLAELLRLDVMASEHLKIVEDFADR